MKKIVLLFGGQSLEHEVSIESAQSILENIDKKKYRLIPIVIDKEGEWYFYHGEVSNLPNWKEENIEKIDNIVHTLKEVDVVFPMIHGAYGEDGKLQGFLEMFHIPYVGCTSKSSMLGMDKEYTKILAEYYNIPILPYGVLTKKNLKEKIDFPVIVKPASGGSSIGIDVAHNEKELLKKYKEAAACDSKVIIEKYAKVREFEIGILTDKKKCYYSGIGEILTNGDVYNYERKYIQSISTTTEVTLSKEVEDRIYELAHQLVSIFDLKGMARIDFFYEEESNSVYFNEINTIPGFTTISMYPKLWEAKKISYKELLTRLIESVN